MSLKPIYMESTEISPAQSASEVCMALVQAGARSVTMTYGVGGKVDGLKWTMMIGAKEIAFIMPARIEPVYTLLRKRFGGAWDSAAEARMKAKAERVAWRQLLRWVLAQVAMIEVGMVSGAEPFAPYIEWEPGRTMFQCFESKQLALPAPAGE
jgi:hypothetical protein